jgi:tetratricopeptide (TPR) repeat protein
MLRFRCNAAIIFLTASQSVGYAVAQLSPCIAVAPHTLTAAEKAYSDGFYARAEQLYSQALAEQPQNSALASRLVETLLHEEKIVEAAQHVEAAMAANPSSAAVLTAQAEVQLRKGQPWLASKSLDAATAADHCYARAHLVRSRIYRIGSMYASERSELQKAYDIDATDPDILLAWSRIIPAAQEIEGTAKALYGMGGFDQQTRTKAEDTIKAIMPLLHEDSQTCGGVPATAPISIPLLPSRQDGKHIDGFRIEVKFPKGPATLQVDTATSGFYITQTSPT